jgi:serine/threonine-protein kinase HipA
MSSPQSVYVWTDAFQQQSLVGRVTVIPTGVSGRSAGEFVYAESYLAADGGYSLDPIHLVRDAGRIAYETRSGLPAVLLDAGPDDWGQRVLAELPRPPQTPIETLLAGRGIGVGALLFSLSRDSVKPRDPALALEELEAAFTAVVRIERRQPLSQNALRMLAAGATLGGARPKVPVADAAASWIAKFPSERDAVDQPLIEHASLKLAKRAGITVAESQLQRIGKRQVLLVRRFDVPRTGRLPYLSMFAAIVNGEPLNERRAQLDYGYPGMAAFITRFGGEPLKDRTELFRRAAFNLMLGHVDDHDHNHGFLLHTARDNAWRLAPAFDVAPSNGEALSLAKVPQVQAIGLGVAGRERSLVNLFSALGDYALTHEEAVTIYRKTLRTVRRWQAFFAEEHGVTQRDLKRMAHRVLAEDIDWEAIPLPAAKRSTKKR